MPTVQIREFPQPLYDLLSLKAQQQHRSLTQQTVAELEQALQPQVQGLRRLQVLRKLRSQVLAHAPGHAPAHAPGQASVQALVLGDQLERWQRDDRDR